jgi:hypothetical protein
MSNVDVTLAGLQSIRISDAPRYHLRFGAERGSCKIVFLTLSAVRDARLVTLCARRDPTVRFP